MKNYFTELTIIYKVIESSVIRNNHLNVQQIEKTFN